MRKHMRTYYELRVWDGEYAFLLNDVNDATSSIASHKVIVIFTETIK